MSHALLQLAIIPNVQLLRAHVQRPELWRTSRKTSGPSTLLNQPDDFGWLVSRTTRLHSHLLRLVYHFLLADSKSSRCSSASRLEATRSRASSISIITSSVAWWYLEPWLAQRKYSVISHGLIKNQALTFLPKRDIRSARELLPSKQIPYFAHIGCTIYGHRFLSVVYVQVRMPEFQSWSIAVSHDFPLFIFSLSFYLFLLNFFLFLFFLFSYLFALF
jgi:hypothetical protein